jgi:hypothetical protein
MHAGRLVLLDTPAAFMRSDEPRARAYRETLRLNEELLAALASDGGGRTLTEVEG